MKQFYAPNPDPPPEDEGLPKASGPSMDQKNALDSAQDLTEEIEAIIDESQSLEPLSCCGKLPCKGRTPACYSCDICMDCITGVGCGHDDSNHDPQSAQTLG
jgi:hypothetical protein